jgi:hypothetical protein
LPRSITPAIWWTLAGVVGQERLHTVLLPEAGEHVGEGPAVRIQFLLTFRAADASPAEHGGVEVGSERQPLKPWPVADTQRHALEVGVVEVPVREAHRLSTVPAHGQESLSMIVGVEQADLSPDQLSMGVRGSVRFEIGHLITHGCQSVLPVHPHLVGIPRVVAGCARKVAAGEDSVRSLASGAHASEGLPWRLDRIG